MGTISVSKHLNDTHYDFEFADLGDGNTGIVSLYDIRYSSSVLQTLTGDQDWYKDGYSCTSICQSIQSAVQFHRMLRRNNATLE